MRYARREYCDHERVGNVRQSMDAIVGNGGWLWTIAGVTGLLLCLESCAEDRCNGTLPERPGPNEAGLVLYLHPEQCKYVRGGLIFIDVELYNAGTATRVLSTALSPPQHVVKYEVSDPSGRILPGPLIEVEWKPAAADFM